MLQSSTDYQLHSQWTTADTQLSLSGQRLPDTRTLMLSYGSTVLAPRLYEERMIQVQDRQRTLAGKL
ncbi:hypothetical protein [Corallococcus llansteffanensis]|uniref:Uncharacterized protein n=1 Tax=Corallococcus llansteffanensis TaxID=2316731 RepID=A0A3A8Q993_9BACT|nr:hypothetical protein [Corallococcus llansteffanensis]RKH62765.1 hypothetical protein D7V93_09690 [Corallococcus llansteffanensis]